MKWFVFVDVYFDFCDVFYSWVYFLGELLEGVFCGIECGGYDVWFIGF